MISRLLNRKRARKINKYFNSEKGLKKIPYTAGSMFIDWFCSTSFALNEFFSKKIYVVNDFLGHFPGKYDEKKIKIRFFRTNFLHGWRAASLANLDDKRYFRKINITGLDIFKKYYNKGKGVVILNSHYGLPSVLISLFPALGYKDYYSIVGEMFRESTKYRGLKKNRRPRLLSFGRGPQSETFKFLFEARDLLESGGVLHLLGDGMHGISNVNIEFLGKKRGYRSSFAELGLISGSPVIPVFALPDKKGKINVEFLHPLDAGDEELEHEERVKYIVKQYSDLLEQRWIDNPGYINGGFIDMYNKQVRLFP